MSRPAHTCGPDDTVQDALLEMSRHGARRLPVVRDGDLKGVVSIDDIILWGVNHGPITQHVLIAALRPSPWLSERRILTAGRADVMWK